MVLFQKLRLSLNGFCGKNYLRTVARITTSTPYSTRSGAILPEQDHLARLLIQNLNSNQRFNQMDRNNITMSTIIAQMNNNSVAAALAQIAQQQPTTSNTTTSLSPYAISSSLLQAAAQQHQLMIAANNAANLANSAAAAAIQQATTGQQIYPFITTQVPTVQPQTVDISTSLYYQPVPNRTSMVCTCACSQMNCPVHAYESLPTPPAIRQPYGSERIGSIVVHRQPPVVPHQVLPGRMGNSSNSIQQIQIPPTTNLVQGANFQQQQQRLKRNQNFNSDGRQGPKVRRIGSIDDSMPGSSQMDNRSIRRDFNNGYDFASHNTARMCSTCTLPFGPNNPRVQNCPCHNQPYCEDGVTICRACYETSNNSLLVPQLTTLQMAMLEARRRSEERRRHEANFYSRYELPIAVQNPATPMVYFNQNHVLLFNGTDMFLNPATIQQATTTQTHLLQQVLAQNPHIQEPMPVGATTDQIKKNTTISNYVKDPNVPENEKERCTVCLMEFETGDDVRTLNCSHNFHIDCIDRWLVYNKKCPVCRIDMDKPGTFASVIDYEQLTTEATAS